MQTKKFNKRKKVQMSKYMLKDVPKPTSKGGRGVKKKNLATKTYNFTNFIF